MVKPPDKKQTLLAFLERGVTTLHLDARRAGVVVPAQHAGDAHLLLNFSYRYAIPDLTIDARGVKATLSFRSQPFQCTLPWTAVFGITSQATGAGQAWPEDIPAEVAEQFGAPEEKSAPAKAGQKPRRKPRPAGARPSLRALGEVPGQGAEPASAPQPALAPPASPGPDEAPSPATRGHLRLVK